MNVDDKIQESQRDLSHETPKNKASKRKRAVTEEEEISTKAGMTVLKSAQENEAESKTTRKKKKRDFMDIDEKAVTEKSQPKDAGKGLSNNEEIVQGKEYQKPVTKVEDPERLKRTIFINNLPVSCIGKVRTVV
jgi:hypothetical protein